MVEHCSQSQKFLGHSTIKMTADIYTHTSAEAEREAALAVERAIYCDLFPVVPKIENGNNSAALNSDLLTYRLGKMPRNHANDEAGDAISFCIVAVSSCHSRCT